MLLLCCVFAQSNQAQSNQAQLKLSETSAPAEPHRETWKYSKGFHFPEKEKHLGTAEEQQDWKGRALSDGCVSHAIYECNSSNNIKCYFAIPFQMQFLFFNLPSLLIYQV